MDYSNLLKSAKLKATIQRVTLLEIIDHDGHSSIDDIYALTKESMPTLALATIYKNILLLLEKGILEEVAISGKKSKYEIKKADHIHLICQTCGSVEDKHLDKKIEESIDISIDEDIFHISKSHINLYGICKKCNE